jgi:hypothetical protein
MTAPQRRWFRFSLRMLFVMVTVAATAAGCVSYQLNWIRERHAVLAKVRDSTSDSKDTAIQAPLALRVFGEPAVAWIAVGGGYSNSESDRIKSLFPEARTVRDVGHPDQIFVSFVYTGPMIAARPMR